MKYRTDTLLLASLLWISPSLTAQQLASLKTVSVPFYLRSEHEKAMKGDVMAMIKENSKAEEIGLPKRYSDREIISKLEERAKAGNTIAKLKMLIMRESSGMDPLPRTPEREIQIRALTKRLADAGDAEGMVAWSVLLARDGSIKKDWDEKEIAYWYYKAWDYYEAKAKQGDLQAMKTLLEIPMPATPSLVTSDIGNRTMYWREQAAIHGDPESMMVVGSRLTDPRTPDRVDEGVEWYLRSAKAGYWKAMLLLASYYAHGTIQRLKGEEPKPDPANAWYWLDRAVGVTGNLEIWKKFMDEEEGDFMEGFPPRPGSK